MKFVEINVHGHCTSVHFSIQPTRTPAHNGQAGPYLATWREWYFVYKQP